MQTKSVLTALSLAMLLSTTAFGMMPQLAAVLGRSGIKVALATGITLGASPLFVQQVKQRNLARQATETRKAKQNRKTRKRERLHRSIAIANQLPTDVIRAIEKNMPKVYRASVDDDAYMLRHDDFEGVKGRYDRYFQALLDEQLEQAWLRQGVEKREERLKRLYLNNVR